MPSATAARSSRHQERVLVGGAHLADERGRAGRRGGSPDLHDHVADLDAVTQARRHLAHGPGAVHPGAVGGAQVLDEHRAVADEDPASAPGRRTARRARSSTRAARPDGELRARARTPAPARAAARRRPGGWAPALLRRLAASAGLGRPAAPVAAWRGGTPAGRAAALGGVTSVHTARSTRRKNRYRSASRHSLRTVSSCSGTGASLRRLEVHRRCCRTAPRRRRRSWCSATRAPLTLVPLVEPRSTTTNPSPDGRTSAWRRLTLGSASTIVQSCWRPTDTTYSPSGHPVAGGQQQRPGRHAALTLDEAGLDGQHAGAHRRVAPR